MFIVYAQYPVLVLAILYYSVLLISQIDFINVHATTTTRYYMMLEH
jgi:hypothetical protein